MYTKNTKKKDVKDSSLTWADTETPPHGYAEVDSVIWALQYTSSHKPTALVCYSQAILIPLDPHAQESTFFTDIWHL